jgi:histidinol-phosphate phosphatase family protein
MNWVNASQDGSAFAAVLLDRDGTLIFDEPYCGDPSRVRPVDGAREALDALRASGLALGVITNQSGIGRGLLSHDQVDIVNARVEELLGPFDTWQICPHSPEDGCVCRKPAPGLVARAAAALGTTPDRCVVVGDIGADMGAALAAGATAIMVPTPVTRVEEIAAAPALARDLGAAVEWILYRQHIVASAAPAPEGRHVLVVRPDSLGDLLLTGPAIRAVADRAGKVTVWCGARGVAAASLLPGIDAVIEWTAPWIAADPAPVDLAETDDLVARLRAAEIDEAIVFTSYHQSPLPAALLLRLAGVRRVSAISEDYPGSLLDVRHRVAGDLGLAEPLRALSLAAAAGYPLPAHDNGRLRVTVPEEIREPDLVVLHPGSHAQARAVPDDVATAVHDALDAGGWKVVVTAGPDEATTSDLADLAGLLSRASCLVTGNTGPAHLAAAVGTPVVSLFAPTVPFGQWAPYRTAVARLGDPMAPCSGTRTVSCRLVDHPCLSGVDPQDVVAAVRRLTAPVAGGPA